MKILVLTGYAYLDGKSAFMRSTSGFGYTVGKIISELAKIEGNSVSVLTQSAFTREDTAEHVHLVHKTWADIFSGLSQRYLRWWLWDTRSLSLLAPMRWRALAYYLTGRYAERVIKQIQPDIVNVHGIGLATQPFLYACRQAGVPYVLTLHGLNTFHDECLPESWVYQLERGALQQVLRGDFPLTVVASGIKSRVLAVMGGGEGKNIYPIPNGTDISSATEAKSIQAIRVRWNIQPEDHVLICCGALTANKNQSQLLRACALLPEELRAHLKVLIVGGGPMMEALTVLRQELGLEQTVCLTGQVPPGEVANYYAISDVNALTSISEGFGNAMIEGFMFGLPSVCFSDLDAVPDIYDPRAVVLAETRTDEALAAALETALTTAWDSAHIRQHSLRFTASAMGRQYHQVFSQVIQDYQSGQ